MYKTRKSLIAPQDDAILWRYMSFTKFMSLLMQNALFFARADRLGDPFEGSLSQLNIELSPAINKGIPDKYIKQLHEYIKDKRRFTLVNCWHESQIESDAMWKLYAPYGEGIAVRTDFGSLKESLVGEDIVHIGRVNYVDYGTTFIRENDPLAPFIHKRKSFEHEKEVRAIIEKHNSIDGKIVVGGPDIYEDGLYHEVKIQELIKEVVVPPYAQDWFLELAQSAVNTFGLQAPVTRSSMDALPVWS